MKKVFFVLFLLLGCMLDVCAQKTISYKVCDGRAFYKVEEVGKEPMYYRKKLVDGAVSMDFEKVSNGIFGEQYDEVNAEVRRIDGEEQAKAVEELSRKKKEAKESALKAEQAQKEQEEMAKAEKERAEGARAKAEKAAAKAKVERSLSRVFNYTETLDKFEDVIAEKSVKTLVRRDDSIFSFEEKGCGPVYYKVFISDDYQPRFVGSKDRPVQLINNVYGYEEEYYAVPVDSLNRFYALLEVANSKPDSMVITYDKDGNFVSAGNERQSLSIGAYVFLMRSVVSIAHRVVTTQHSGDFVDEFFWISFEDETRKLFMNKRK